MPFTLHPQLAKDTITVGDFKLCRVLLAKDENYPWLILVPRVESITEFHQLNNQEQAQYLIESNTVSLFLKESLNADKINIAALGNMVPQLHIHHVARYKQDIAWPNPIWGQVPAKIRNENDSRQLIQTITTTLKAHFI